MISGPTSWRGDAHTVVFGVASGIQVLRQPSPISSVSLAGVPLCHLTWESHELAGLLFLSEAKENDKRSQTSTVKKFSSWT